MDSVSNRDYADQEITITLTYESWVVVGASLLAAPVLLADPVNQEQANTLYSELSRQIGVALALEERFKQGPAEP